MRFFLAIFGSEIGIPFFYSYIYTLQKFLVMNLKKEYLSVILVDDIEDEHILFRKALAAVPRLDVDVKCFFSAQELESFLEETEVVPHVVFLDMHMPEKNGLECLKDIRSLARVRELVVAMYSVSSDNNIIQNCLANGANIYITKPRKFKELTERLHDVIKSCMRYHTMSMDFDTFIKRF